MNIFFRKVATLGVVVSVGVASLMVVSVSSSSRVEAKAARATKYGVCHRTNAIKNPYRYITVAWSAVNADGGGHDNTSHDGPVFNYSNPVSSHGTVPRDSGLGTESGGSNNRWGDIFNAVKNQGQQNSNNWTTAGQAIFNGTAINALTGKPACKRMTTADFIRAEMEAQRDDPGLGITMASVMASLDDMNATEDFATKEALGGSFTTWYTNNGNGSQDPSVINSLIAVEAPGVTTTPPSNVQSNSATLNGTISPKGETMTYYFEFSTDSSFPDTNATVETTSATSSSSTTVSINANRTGLTAGRTYYYRTVGVINNGLAVTDDNYMETVFYGVTEQFNSNSAAAPAITSVACSNQGLTVSFSKSSTSGVDRYEYSIDGGDWTTATLSGAITDATNSFAIASLLNGTEYSIRVRAFETTGSVPGATSVSSTGTPCGVPTATTQPATSVQNTSAVLNGIVTSNGATTTVVFEYKPQGGAANCAAVDFSSGATSVSVTSTLSASAIDSSQTATLTGLAPSTAYCYRIVGSNTPGTSNGDPVLFTTFAAAQPTVTTTAATSVTTTTATLNGTGTPNGAETTARFTYKAGSSDFSSGTITEVLTPTIGSGNSAVPLSYALTGLTPGTTYYFQASVSNSNTGGAYIDGVILSFTTPLPAPVATTNNASSVTQTTATLNGTIDPNNASTTVEFTWGISQTLATGNTVTVAIQSPLDGSSNGVAVTANLTGLTGGTTYYFRVSAANTNGNDDGEILSFTTTSPSTNPGQAPGTQAVADPGRVIGTAWFDINKNNKKEDNEPLLVGVDVNLEPTASSASKSSSGIVRAQATQVLKTDANGAFDFTTVNPGTYVIKGVLPKNFGIEQSWDSTGNTDWQVSVTVLARQTARGDFAAIGDVQVLTNLSPEECDALGDSSDISMDWAGFDQSVGNSDDASFASSLNDNCSFEVTGVPTGKYSLTATNPTTGKQVSLSKFTIPRGAARVEVTVGKKTADVKVIAVKTAAILPATGSSTQTALQYAWAMVVIGFALIVMPMFARRRRRH